jgi:hypothetical protein
VLYLLNWQVWVLVALLISYPSIYLKGRHDGKRVEQQATAALVAQANIEARKNEQLRQDRVDEAAKSAALREVRIRADAAGARTELDGLRGTLDAVERAAASSLSASNEALSVTAGLFGRCTARYTAVAEGAAIADSEAREIRQSWPK